MATKGQHATIDNPGNSKIMLWFREHRDYSGDECLIWPFAKLQSGYANFGKRQIAAHRFMCELRNGPPPTAKHQAAHSCGRGSSGCVSPVHLSWKTNAENQIERYQHSGPVAGTKLTLAQVTEIRALKGKQKTGETAKLYGTSETNVRDIQSGRSRSGPNQRRVFSADEIRAIRNGPKTARETAVDFSASIYQIHAIRQRLFYKHVPDDYAHSSAHR